jgi:hypothetical protein
MSQKAVYKMLGDRSFSGDRHCQFNVIDCRFLGPTARRFCSELEVIVPIAAAAGIQQSLLSGTSVDYANTSE